MVVKSLDVRGRACPMPIVELMRTIGPLAAGSEIEIRADDNAFPADVKAWCNKTGHILLELVEDRGCYLARIRKKAAS